MKNFYNHSFNIFDETGDRVSVENWLNDMEELLDTTECTKEQNVAYTTFKLSGKPSDSGR